MNWSSFVFVLLFGEILVFLQGGYSFLDGYLSASQMHKEERYGYSFLQHGGMWADFFLITPLVAYLVGKYQFSYATSLVPAFIVAFIVWWALARYFYASVGNTYPEAHAHNGFVTVAGWIHVIYAALATSVITMVYISGVASPPISGIDIIIVSVVLMAWAAFGVVKFSPVWKWSSFYIMQVGIEVAAIAILAGMRIW